TAELHTLSLHDALPISWGQRALYAGALACVLLAGGLWTGAFSDNQARLEQLRRITEVLLPAREQAGAGEDLQRLLAVLDASQARSEEHTSELQSRENLV